MEAFVEWINDRDGSEIILVGGHRIQFGGANGDGFCYTHNSFACLDELSKEEKEAIQNAKEK